MLPAASYVMYATAEDVRAKSGWLGRDGGSRAELVRQLQGARPEEDAGAPWVLG